MATPFNRVRETATAYIEIFRLDTSHPLIVIQPKRSDIIPFLHSIGNRRAKFITQTIDQMIERAVYGSADIELCRVGFGVLVHTPDNTTSYTTFLCRSVDKSTHLVLDFRIVETDPTRKTHSFVVASINQVPQITYKPWRQAEPFAVDLVDRDARERYVSIVDASDRYLEKLDEEIARRFGAWERSMQAYERLSINSLQRKVAVELKKLMEAKPRYLNSSRLARIRRYGLKMTEHCTFPDFRLAPPSFITDVVLVVEFRAKGDLASERFLPVHTTDPAEIAKKIFARLLEFSAYARKLDSLTRTLDKLASS